MGSLKGINLEIESIDRFQSYINIVFTLHIETEGKLLSG